MGLAADIDEIYTCKGQKVVHLDLRKEKPGAQTLAGMLLGPTGNLRAPTFRHGRTLVVGFNEETYKKLLL